MAPVLMLKLFGTGSLGEMPSSEHQMDKFYGEKLLSPLATPAAQNFSLKASSLLGTKKGCTSFPGEIVPANRSSLSSDNGKVVGCQSSRDKCGMVLHGKKTVLSQERDGVDLADSCQLSEKSKNMLMAPCVTKKRKFITGEYDLKQIFGNSNEHSSGGVDLQCKDIRTSQSRSPEFVREKASLPVDSAPGDETQGSAFLAQVRDKLSAAEYMNFVGYMKAFKSKAMKMSEVLQCIFGLFSGPERLPLLERILDVLETNASLIPFL
ncbi:regulator of telomere elongation helicase 1-like protein isoform X1 [Sesbania bispinosa]|nr:regulator of telomere elongation helicase 1-like protein isoform X1 [Sesbania bispinosa]